MPAEKQLRCGESLNFDEDAVAGAKKCGSVALACVDCGESAGCPQHAQHCPKCGRPVCAYCEDEHTCSARKKARAA